MSVDKQIKDNIKYVESAKATLYTLIAQMQPFCDRATENTTKRTTIKFTNLKDIMMNIGYIKNMLDTIKL